MIEIAHEILATSPLRWPRPTASARFAALGPRLPEKANPYRNDTYKKMFAYRSNSSNSSAAFCLSGSNHVLREPVRADPGLDPSSLPASEHPREIGRAHV